MDGIYVQNLSNCCRYKYDQSVSQIFFELISGGFLPMGPTAPVCPGWQRHGSGIVVEKWPHFFLFEAAVARQPPWSLEDGL